MVVWCQSISGSLLLRLLLLSWTVVTRSPRFSNENIIDVGYDDSLFGDPLNDLNNEYHEYFTILHQLLEVQVNSLVIFSHGANANGSLVFRPSRVC